MFAMLATAFVACDKEDDNQTDETTEKVSSKDNAVDLGLTSGTKWAKMNVGATNPWDFGDYFAWGETKPKETYYEWQTYLHIAAGETNEYGINKYQVADGTNGVWYTKEFERGLWYAKDFVGDGKTELEDAAFANWGGKWKTPTKEQVEELEKECYWLYTENYADTTNVRGYIIFKAKEVKDRGKKIPEKDLPYVTLPEGYSLADTHIFMPETGFKNGKNIVWEGIYGYFWTSTLTANTRDAYSLNMENPWTVWPISRCLGLAVRPVCK